MYNRELKRRECCNDIYVLDIETNEWTDTWGEGNTFESRRYHIAAIISKMILVYGGLNAKNEYLGDLRVLSLDFTSNIKGENKMKFVWSIPVTSGIEPGPLACHACQMVLNPDRYKHPSLNTLYFLPDYKNTYSKVYLKLI